MSAQYSQMVISRLGDAGEGLCADARECPEWAFASDVLLVAAAAGLHGWLLFSHSPVIEATLAIASSAT